MFQVTEIKSIWKMGLCLKRDKVGLSGPLTFLVHRITTILFRSAVKPVPLTIPTLTPGEKNFLVFLEHVFHDSVPLHMPAPPRPAPRISLFLLYHTHACLSFMDELKCTSSVILSLMTHVRRLPLSSLSLFPIFHS